MCISDCHDDDHEEEEEVEEEEDDDDSRYGNHMAMMIVVVIAMTMIMWKPVLQFTTIDTQSRSSLTFLAMWEWNPNAIESDPLPKGGLKFNGLMQVMQGM
jgi:hypothetical protein